MKYIVHTTPHWEQSSIGQVEGSLGFFYSALPQHSADADTTFDVTQDGE